MMLALNPPSFGWTVATCLVYEVAYRLADVGLKRWRRKRQRDR